MSIDKSKINDEMTKRGNFTMIPNEIWECEDLDHIAKLIWCYIYSRKSTWSSSQNNVARNLGLHANTVAKHVQVLVKLNMLITSKGANNTTNYEILPPSTWYAKISAPHIQAHQCAPGCEQVCCYGAHTKEVKKVGKKDSLNLPTNIWEELKKEKEGKDGK